MVVWRTVNALRLYAYQDDMQVGAVYEDSEGYILAWAWPTNLSQKRHLGKFITISRAREAVEDALAMGL